MGRDCGVDHHLGGSGSEDQEAEVGLDLLNSLILAVEENAFACLYDTRTYGTMRTNLDPRRDKKS